MLGAFTNSVASQAVVASSGASTAPTSVRAVAGNGQVSLTWNAPRNNGGSAVIDYLVQVSQHNSTTWLEWVKPVSSNRSYTVTGLTNGTSYIFRVSAVNSSGPSTWSLPSSPVRPTAPTTTTTIAPQVPRAPTNVRATPGNRRAELSWSAASTARNTPVTDYIIEYSTNDGTWSQWFVWADATSPATTGALTNLTNGIDIRFRVAAVNSAGISPYSSISATVRPALPTRAPSIPRLLNAVAQQQETIVVTWEPPSRLDEFTYTLQFSADNGRTWTPSELVVPEALSATLTNLTRGATYRFRVAATNSVGTSAWALSKSVRVPNNPTPSSSSSVPPSSSSVPPSSIAPA
jgi:predicted phage tail protein